MSEAGVPFAPSLSGVGRLSRLGRSGAYCALDSAVPVAHGRRRGPGTCGAAFGVVMKALDTEFAPPFYATTWRWITPVVAGAALGAIALGLPPVPQLFQLEGLRWL